MQLINLIRTASIRKKGHGESRRAVAPLSNDAHGKKKYLEPRRDSLREIIAPYFDEDYYIAKNADVATAGIPPLLHYIEHGESEGRRPSKVFDPSFYSTQYASELNGLAPLAHYALYGRAAGNRPNSEGFDYDWYKLVYLNENASNSACHDHYESHNVYSLLQRSGDAEFIKLRSHFDSTYYLDTYPDIAGIDPWIHYVGTGRKEGRRISQWYRDGLGDVKDQIVSVMRQAWELQDIDLALNRVGLADMPNLPSSYPSQLDDLQTALLRFIKEINSPVSSLMVVGSLGIGGAERYAANIFKVLARTYGVGNVLMLVTETSRGLGMSWLPENARVLSISDVLPAASREDRCQFVRRLISVIQPASTYCVNSRALWDAILKPRNALSTFTTLRACLFCYDYDNRGAPVGYAATEFRQAFSIVEQFIIDNDTFADQLKRDCYIPQTLAQKIVVAKTPVSVRKPRRTENHLRPRVLWTGRLARQKIPQEVGKIAELCSGLVFDMYSAPGPIEGSSLNMPSNVKFKPAYDPLAGPPFDDYGAFLYTSIWDGIPTALLDAASAGLPIVGSSAGGIGEILTKETGWPVSDPYDTQQYSRALAEIFLQPEEVKRRTSAMYRKLEEDHSWEVFEKRVRETETSE